MFADTPNKINFVSQTYRSLAGLMTADRPVNHPVAYQGQQLLTWQQFQHDVAALCGWLADCNVDRVALCADDSYLFAVGFVALCHSGKTLVLPGNHQSGALTELADQYQLLLTDSERQLQPEISCQDIRAAAQNPAAMRFEPLDLDQIQIVLYTSGSSGKAKAIEKTLSQLDSELSILQALWGKQLAGCHIESTVSHQHIYGLLFRLLWPLCAARPFSCDNIEFPEQVIARAGPQCALVSSPALLKRLTQESASPELATLFSSGGPLQPASAEQAFKLFGHYPIEVFGSTETGGIAYRQQNCAQPLWQLFPGVEAELNAEQCIRLRAPHINLADWYQTSDQCRFHGSGQFELLGRTDRIVKLEEKRISLQEVEKRLEQLQWVADNAVIAMQQGNRTVLVAALVLTESGQQKLAEIGKGPFWLLLRKTLRQWLEPVAVPRQFRLVTEIPLNSQGKRQVAVIEQLFQHK